MVLRLFKILIMAGARVRPEADEVIVQGPDFAGFIELGEGDDYALHQS